MQVVRFNRMRLLEEVKTSVKNPLSVKSFYVLFITAFVLILTPLVVIGLIYQGNMFAQARNSCVKPVEREFSGTVGNNSLDQHSFTFAGSGCTLTAWANGSGESDISLWIYEPNGEIQLVDENSDKSYEFFNSAEIANEGIYRVKVRLVSGDSSDYTATVSFR